jgi:hypothetical protein
MNIFLNALALFKNRTLIIQKQSILILIIIIKENENHELGTGFFLRKSIVLELRVLSLLVIG